jgi:uncharacterized protein (TIGR02145 family)
MKHLLTLALVLCLGTFASAQVPSYVPTNGLVGWWPFNGNANDESGNGNHGTVNGATLAADRFGNAGKAYSFDGVNDWITSNPSNKPLNNQDRSISSWFNTSTGIISTSQYPNLQTIIAWGTGAGGYVIFNQYIISPIGKGYFESGSGTNQLFTDSVVNNGQWHNYVTTYEQNGKVKIYLDGRYVDSSSNITLATQNSIIGIGNCPWANIPFRGNIDDIAIYNRALSPAEVQQLYLGNNNNSPGNSSTSTAPQKVNYQAVALNASGIPVKNKAISVRLSILDSSTSGAVLYTETHQPTTDGYGQFATYLGGGTATTGTFANIPWSNNRDKFLKAEADITGGTTYALMGISQLVSVPYALHAGSAQRATELMDSAGNAYQIKIVNGQPTLVSAPGNVSIPASFACGQAVTYAGESYPTVQIGSQCWFAKNLNVGSMVLGANDQTNNGTFEKYCYNNDTANCSIYGGLYQWAEAVQYQNGASNTASPSPAFTGNVKGICPTGWHVPSDGEWCALTMFLDSTVNCSNFIWTGTDIGSKLKSISGYWFSSSVSSTNSSNFNAIPSGGRNTNGTFANLGRNNYIWTSNEGSLDYGIGRDLYYNDSRIGRNNFIPKNGGKSIRCLKD